MCSTFRGTVIGKRIDLSKFVAANVPSRVVGDRYRLEHVISNLLSNAIKFSKEDKSVSITVAADSFESKGNGESHATLTVTVTDEGTYVPTSTSS